MIASGNFKHNTKKQPRANSARGQKWNVTPVPGSKDPCEDGR